MSFTFLLIEYIRWHYDDAIGQFWHIWKDFLWFGYNFFSIPLLARTLFAPIYRIHEGYDMRGLQIELILQSFVVNVVARVAGFFMRITVIIVGLIFECILLLLAPILFIVWVMLPVLSPILFIFGFFLLW